jgi:hypothetical protein
MADSKAEIQAKVREMLDQKPDASTDELQEAAIQIDSGLTTLSRRQFNAGYVLPVKRARAASGAPKSRGARGTRRRGKARGRKAKTAAPDNAAAPAQRARRAGRPAKNASAMGGERDRVREVLLRFAADLTRAESRAEIIDLLGSLDNYVDDALAAAR